MGSPFQMTPAPRNETGKKLVVGYRPKLLRLHFKWRDASTQGYILKWLDRPGALTDERPLTILLRLTENACRVALIFECLRTWTD